MHPVSRSCLIVSNALALPFNRVEQIARALIHVRLLPPSIGRAVPDITAVQLLALVASATFADRVLDALPVAAAFHALREHPGGNSGADNFGQFFAGVMADPRDDHIEIDLIRVFDFRQASQFEARVIVNGDRLFVFGEPLPPRIAREEVVRITYRAFAKLRQDFNSAEPAMAREYAR